MDRFNERADAAGAMARRQGHELGVVADQTARTRATGRRSAPRRPAHRDVRLDLTRSRT